MHGEPGAPGPVRRGPTGLGAPAPLLFRRAGPAAHERGAAGPSSLCHGGGPRVAGGTSRVDLGQVNFLGVATILIAPVPVA
jgi:hypothetical protein